MTREDALFFLVRFRRKGINEKLHDALGVAIEALEAMGNAQNTLQHVVSVERPTVIRSRTLMSTKDFKEWAKRIREESPNVIVIPCDAEVVSAEAGWIPCSERLPEVGHIVLITAKSTLSDDFYVMWANVVKILNNGSLLDGARFYTEQYGEINEQHGFKVIAWQPLPEPYREDGEA